MAMRAWGHILRRGLALILALGLWGWASPAIALGGPQPELNQPAPEFTLPTNAGDGRVSLTDYQGQWVVLYFYPQDFTSGCTLEAKRFKQDYEQYRVRNTQILGVSTDDVASHASFCESEGLTFPLLSDPKGKVIRTYGSWLSGRALRHTYVIDPDGILRARFLGVRPAIHSQAVLATLDELQSR